VVFMMCLLMMQDVVERVSVELVLIDVLAFDRQGEPVTDLTLDDFVVREGRKKVDVTVFEKLDMRTADEITFRAETIEEEEVVRAEETGAVRQTQQLVLVIDLEAVPHIEVARTFDLLYDFVESLDPAFDYDIEVLSLEYGSYTKGFVENQRLVRDALEEMQQRYLSNTVESYRGQGTLLGSLDRGERPANNIERTQTLADLEKQLKDCRDMAYDTQQAERCMNGYLRSFIDNQYMRTRRVILELQSVSERFDDDKQLKTVLLVSPGFSVDGIDSVFQLRDAILYPRADVNPGMRGGLGTRSLFSDRSNEEEYQNLLHNCLANRIMIHVFDIYNNRMEHNRGISAEFASASTSVRSIYGRYNDEITSGTFSVAEDTGGTFTRSFGLGKAMTRVIERSRFSYQIGYVSPPGKPGKWRNIKIKCKRRGVKIQYRNGYFAQ